MTTLRTWLAAIRPNTSGLTVAGALLGAVVADTELSHDWLFLLAIGAWAFILHSYGFLTNSIRDLPFDRADPSKAHFPLVCGVLSSHAAREAARYGCFATLVLGALLAGVSAGPLLLLLAVVLFGEAYNFTSKRGRWALLWISLSFAALPAFTYSVAGGDWTRLVGWYVPAYTFVMILCQIGVWGYLKDLATDPVSILRDLGARATRVSESVYCYEIPPRAFLYAIGLRSLAPGLACGFAAAVTGPSSDTVFGVAFATIGLAVLTGTALTSGLRGRSEKLYAIAAGEYMAYTLLLTSLLPIALGVEAWFALALGPALAAVTFNRITWGTWTEPRI